MRSKRNLRVRKCIDVLKHQAKPKLFFLSATRFRRANNGRSKRKKNRRRNKKKTFSTFENDFNWGGGKDNPYADAYGGKFRNRHCQKRVFR